VVLEVPSLPEPLPGPGARLNREALIGLEQGQLRPVDVLEDGSEIVLAEASGLGGAGQRLVYAVAP